MISDRKSAFSSNSSLSRADLIIRKDYDIPVIAWHTAFICVSSAVIALEKPERERGRGAEREGQEFALDQRTMTTRLYALYEC